MWKYIKAFGTLSLLVLFVFFCGVSSVSASGGFVITNSQMEELMKLIDSIEKNNNDLITKLDNLRAQHNTTLTLYENKFILAQEQLTTYENSLKKYESKQSLYKYGALACGIVGLLLGVMIAK